MKLYPLCLLLLSSWAMLSAQNIQFVPESSIALEAAHPSDLDYQTFEISFDDFKEELIQTPKENSVGLKRSATQISLPLPDGTFRAFRVVESSVLQTADQARWPQLRTYKILDVDNPLYNGRLAVTPNGVTAFVRSAGGDVLIEPYVAGQNDYHMVYYSDNAAAAFDIPSLGCAYHAPDETGKLDEHQGAEKTSASTIKEFTMALTCTGEYASIKGGTIESVMASFVESMSIANAIFEQEVGVRVVLIGDVEQLIYLNAASDPFVMADFGEGLLDQVRNAITSQGFPTTSYDMGHVFTGGCTDVGGIVGGNTCSPGKDRGVTCHFTGNLGAVISNVFSHEVAHQFGVAHTFSNCPGNEGQLASGSAFEPGSGSTIMSYSGACDNQDIGGSTGSNIYYHGHSLDQFITFVTVTNGAACANVIPTDNTAPKLTLNYTDGFYIPISTPFELIAFAEDEQDDPLTYCWEQMDLEVQIADIGEPVGNAPLFRSLTPSEEPNRVFPRMNYVVNDISQDWEVLPTYSRDLTFRCTVRDNNPEIGDLSQQDIAFRSTATAGPFVVLSPNSASDSWAVGEYREVSWDVANTDNELVNCKLVDIRLSSDGGFTYPHTLLENAPNTGSAFLFVPDVVGSNMRIRVEAANNIFFDISNANFSITPAVEPAYTYTMSSLYQEICLPNSATFELTTASVLGFDESIDLEVVSELPEGIEAIFSSNSIVPGESTTITFDMNNLVDYDGPLEIQFATTAVGEEPLIQSLSFDIVDNDMSDIDLLTPVDGLENVSLETDFSWTAIPNAHVYDWELSDEPDFSNIIDSRYAITETAVSPSVQFPFSTLFYWRVRGINECGPGDWQTPQVFHTLNTACINDSPGDLPIPIPGIGPLPTITSEIFVSTSGAITDLNIPFLRVRYAPIRNFYVSLKSPEGTEVRIFETNCGTDLVRVGFDDEAAEDLICPPDNGFFYRPVEPLSSFDGEDSEGVWTLTVQILETGFGSPGELTEWGLEFCTTSMPMSPSMINNDTLFVPPAMSNTITSDLLNVTDGVQSATELKYSILTLPEHGTLYKAGLELSVGDNFTQNTINSFNLTYLNTNEEAIHDSFTFVVEDGEGGFVPVQRFQIKMTDDAVVSTQTIKDVQAFTLFPNPTSGVVNLTFEQPLDNAPLLSVMDVSGRLLVQDQLAVGRLQYQLHTNDWPAGVYFVRLGSETRRLVKQ